jgi:hypothetical protein
LQGLGKRDRSASKARAAILTLHISKTTSIDDFVMASRSEKFARKFPEKDDQAPPIPDEDNKDEEEIIKFSPEKEAVCEHHFHPP